MGELTESCLHLLQGNRFFFLIYYFVHSVKLALTEMIDDASTDRITNDIDCGPESVQEPVHGQDDGDVVRREADGLEDHDHGDEAGLGNAGSPDTGRGGGDRDGADLTEGEGEVVDLGDEDGGHRLVESSPVHVDGGPDG